MALVNVAFFDLLSKRLVDHEVLSGVRREEAPAVAMRLASLWAGGGFHRIPSPVFLAWESPEDLGIFELDPEFPLSRVVCQEIADQVDALSAAAAPLLPASGKTPCRGRQHGRRRGAGSRSGGGSRRAKGPAPIARLSVVSVEGVFIRPAGLKVG